MLLEKLRKEVLQASLDLLNYNLVTLTGGNVSGRDEQTGYIAITPSGMDYRNLTPSDIVIVDVDGNIIDGKWKASVDLSDHLYIYKHREDINSIIHTHSTYSSCFAILNEPIECASTTLANEVGGSVPVAKFSPPTSKKSMSFSKSWRNCSWSICRTCSYSRCNVRRFSKSILLSKINWHTSATA